MTIKASHLTKIYKIENTSLTEKNDKVASSSQYLVSNRNQYSHLHVYSNYLTSLKSYLVNQLSIYRKKTCLKVDFHSKYKKYIHLYFIVKMYLWNSALVEYLDNWTLSYRLVNLYPNHQKIKSRETLCVFFSRGNSTHTLSEEAFIIIHLC